MPKKKVFIIGAGPAGLSAAYELLSRTDEFNIALMDKSDCIGGLSKTVYYSGKPRATLGGHIFRPGNERFLAFSKKFLTFQGRPAIDDLLLDKNVKTVRGGADPQREDSVMLFRDGLSRFFRKGSLWDYPPTLHLRTVETLKITEAAFMGLSFAKARIMRKTPHTLEDFYINRYGKALYGEFYKDYLEKLYGVSASEILTDYDSRKFISLPEPGRIKAKEKELLTVVPEFREDLQFEEIYYPKFGAGQLWERVAEEVEKLGGRILKGCYAEKFICENSRIKTLIYTEGGVSGSMDADYIISSAPLGEFVPAVEDYKKPESVQRTAEKLQYRNFVGVNVLMKSLEAQNITGFPTLGNIIPDSLIYVFEPEINLCRIQVYNNLSPYMLNNPQRSVSLGLEYFCGGDDGFWNLNDGEIAEFAAAELASTGLIDRRKVLEMNVERAEKALPLYTGSYADISGLKTYLSGIENLCCVGRGGRHSQLDMEGAAQSGFEAADRIINSDLQG
ncbi:MAG: FAD-dependent oxidoreductase [Oscillospiraceae bacterium]|jgi:protoporphyrinogen oxidase|nr:FAD-dependent oxidoreductase [Oscillospiraceae bacterium]